MPRASTEMRAWLRSIFETDEGRASMRTRILEDLKTGDGAFAAKMFSQAYGAPPAELNLDARGDLRELLVAAFGSRAEHP